MVSGSGTLSAASSKTNATGYATVTLTLTQFTTSVQVSACVAPANAPCQPFYLTPVPLAQQNLQPVSGAGQVSSGQAFQPIVVRVTDFSSPPNPVIAASVMFLTTVLRPQRTDPNNPAMPVILKVSQSNATTDMNGLASVVPSSGGLGAPLEVDVGVTAGISAWLDYPLEVFPAVSGSNAGGTYPPSVRPVGISRPVGIQER